MTSLTPVLLVHGTRSSHAAWERQVSLLTAMGRVSRAIDLPGHGSKKNEVFSLESASQLIEQEVERLGGRVILIGISLGGYIALNYAAKHPEQVEAIMAAGCSTETARFATRAYGKTTLFAYQCYQKVRSLLPAKGHTRADEQLPWTVVTDMLSEVGRVSSLANLKILKMPVWIVSGRWCPLRLGERRTLKAGNNVQHRIIERAGHDVNLHAPEAFNLVMIEMLHSLEDKRRYTASSVHHKVGAST